MAEKDRNEGSGQQPPIGQQNDDQRAGQTGGQSATGETSESAGDVGPGGYSPESGGPDLSGGETGLGDVGGGDAPDQGDIEGGTERTANRDSDIEGSSA